MALNARHFPGQRLLRISLRTLHIAAAVIVLGAVHFDVEGEAALQATEWLGLLIASGAGILADDLYRYGPRWFGFAQFWASAAKVVLMAVALFLPDVRAACMWAALVVGSLISHAPGAIRHFEVFGALKRHGPPPGQTSPPGPGGPPKAE